MMHHEFCALTNTNTSYEQYTSKIEPLYMQSELTKQDFCNTYKEILTQPKIYTEFNPIKPNAVYKKDIKYCLKCWLESWQENNSQGTNYDLSTEHFYIIWNDNTRLFLSDCEYAGEKIRMQGIVNIVYQNEFVHMDYFYSDIMDYESYEFFRIFGFLTKEDIMEKGRKYLVIADMDKDYNKHLDTM